MEVVSEGDGCADGQRGRGAEGHSAGQRGHVGLLVLNADKLSLWLQTKWGVRVEFQTDLDGQNWVLLKLLQNLMVLGQCVKMLLRAE